MKNKQAKNQQSPPPEAEVPKEDNKPQSPPPEAEVPKIVAVKVTTGVRTSSSKHPILTNANINEEEPQSIALAMVESNPELKVHFNFA